MTGHPGSGPGMSVQIERIGEDESCQVAQRLAAKLRLLPVDHPAHPAVAHQHVAAPEIAVHHRARRAVSAKSRARAVHTRDDARKPGLVAETLGRDASRCRLHVHRARSPSAVSCCRRFSHSATRAEVARHAVRRPRVPPAVIQRRHRRSREEREHHRVETRGADGLRAGMARSSRSRSSPSCGALPASAALAPRPRCAGGRGRHLDAHASGRGVSGSTSTVSLAVGITRCTEHRQAHGRIADDVEDVAAGCGHRRHCGAHTRVPTAIRERSGCRTSLDRPASAPTRSSPPAGPARRTNPGGTLRNARAQQRERQGIVLDEVRRRSGRRQRDQLAGDAHAGRDGKRMDCRAAAAQDHPAPGRQGAHRDQRPLGERCGCGARRRPARPVPPSPGSASSRRGRRSIQPRDRSHPRHRTDDAVAHQDVEPLPDAAVIEVRHALGTDRVVGEAECRSALGIRA